MAPYEHYCTSLHQKSSEDARPLLEHGFWKMILLALWFEQFLLKPAKIQGQGQLDIGQI